MRDVSQLAGQHLCLLNWRDSTHPEAGGAEVYTEELAERFVAAGARVTLFTSAHSGAPGQEVRRGVEIIRRGGTFGVYLHAAAHLRRARGRYDAVVDFQNGIPFFAPLFVGSDTPVVLVVHHVHQDQFRHRFVWPLSEIGRWLEGRFSRRVYGKRPIVAVSPSTRSEVRLRLGLRGPIYVVPNGIDELPGSGRRSEQPTITVVTRLVPHKRLHLLVDAVAELRDTWPGIHLHIGGRGPALSIIERTVARRDVAGHVTLHGFVTDDQRASLLSQAWLTSLPSEAEGWGLTILEANSLGVPAVALRVPGVRDAIVEGRTGWLADDPADLPALLDEVLGKLADPAEASLVSERCRSWAEQFSWDNSADAFARVLIGESRDRASSPGTPRRHRDLAIKVSFAVEDSENVPELLRRLERELRATDLIDYREGRVTLLLYGADEVLASAVLSRLDVAAPPSFAVVQPHERLVGLGGQR